MNTLNFIGGVGFQEVLLIALVVLLFFGGKKIPELMKGLGRGVKSFKDGMRDIEGEVSADAKGAEAKAQETTDKKGE